MGGANNDEDEGQMKLDDVEKIVEKTTHPAEQ